MSGERHSVAYGLDLAADPPVCVRMTSRGARRSVPWPPDDAARQEIARGAVALSVAVPAPCTVVRRLVAPFASVRKAARVWASLLDMDLPFPVEAAQCDFAPAGKEDGRACAIACAVRRTDLDAFLREAAARGAEPSCCDAEAPALWDGHVHEVQAAGEGRVSLLVHAAADHVTVLWGRGRSLESAHVLRAVPSTLSAGQWLARFRQLSAGALGDGPLDVWWSGCGVGDDCGLRNALAGEPGLRHGTHREPESFLARALARRAVEGRCAGLLPEECIPAPVIARRRVRGRTLYLAVAGISLLVLALNGAVRVRYGAERARLEAGLRDAASAIVGVDVPLVPGQEVLQAQRALSEDADGWNAVREARMPSGREARALECLRALADRDVLFTRVAWSSAGLEIAGDAPSPRAVENLPSGWSPDVSVQPAPGGGRCTFRMKGGWPDEN